MAALLLIACLSVALMALAVRRALPIAIACVVLWATQQAGYDPLTACLAAAAMFAVGSMVFDRAAMSEQIPVRLVIRGLECLAGAAVAVFFAWSIAHAFGSAETTTQPALLGISAAILGGLITASRYRTA
jgi:hypothetical protein